MAHLEITDLKGSRKVELDKDSIVIGREPSNDVQIFEKRASRKHCEFKKTAAGWTARDLGSSNGTVIAGSKIKEMSLANGTEVFIGDSKIVFVDGQAAEKAPAEKPAAKAPATPAPAKKAAKAAPEKPASKPKAPEKPEPMVADDDDEDEDLAPPSFDDEMPVEEPASAGAPKQPEFYGTFVQDENRARLECVAGAHKGEIIDLASIERLSFGRKPSCDFLLKDKSASGKHFELAHDSESHRFFVSDIGSTNGTYLNGSKLTSEIEISNDDEITIGATVFRFVNPREAALFDAHLDEMKKEKKELAKLRAEEEKEEQSKKVALGVLVGGAAVIVTLIVAAVWTLISIMGAEGVVLTAEGNLIPDDVWSFESGLPTTFETVEVYGQDAGVAPKVVDKPAATEGDGKALRFEVKNAGPDFHLAFASKDGFAIPAGTRAFKAKVNILMEYAGGIAGVRLTFVDGNDFKIAERFSDMLGSSAEWQESIFIARVPAKCEKVIFSIVLAGKIASVTVDNMYLGVESDEAAASQDVTTFFRDPNDEESWNLVGGREGEIRILRGNDAIIEESRWWLESASVAPLPAFQFTSRADYQVDGRAGRMNITGRAFDLFAGDFWNFSNRVNTQANNVKVAIENLSAPSSIPSGSDLFIRMALNSDFFDGPIEWYVEGNTANVFQAREGITGGKVQKVAQLTLFSNSRNQIVSGSPFVYSVSFKPSVAIIVQDETAGGKTVRTLRVYFPANLTNSEMTFAILGEVIRAEYDRARTQALGFALATPGRTINLLERIRPDYAGYPVLDKELEEDLGDLRSKADGKLSSLNEAWDSFRANTADTGSYNRVRTLISEIEEKYPETEYATRAGEILRLLNNTRRDG
ncbi:MAG: FHA domain-containing protein [Planctomycetes bacterium]|nr:FHA domain-containing protein [Planctomycetota bacterium]